MKRLSIVGILPIFLAGVSSASGPGTTSANILKIGVGARAIAMGEAYAAQADDASSLYWNPAGLALMNQRQASFMYNQFVEDLTYQHAAIGLPLEQGGLGGSVSYLGYGDIQGYGKTGLPTGNQKAYSAVGTLGGGWLGTDWSFGASFKGIQEKLADESANGFGVDLGANYVIPQPIWDGTVRVGAAVTNLGQGLKFFEERDPLPMEYKVGVAAAQMWDKRINAGIDLAKPRDDKMAIRMGAEYWIANLIALRAGYAGNHTEGMGLRAGLGLKIRGVEFNYAYAGFGELGMTHRYELLVKFGEPRQMLSPEERKMLRQAKAAMKQGDYERSVLLFNTLVDLVPKYRPVRKYLQTAMSKMETSEQTQVARQGKKFDPQGTSFVAPGEAPELDELDAMLKEADGSKAAQAPAETDPMALPETAPVKSDKGAQ